MSEAPATCERCRHAAHGNRTCFNWASDNECSCPGPVVAPAAATDEREALARAISGAWPEIKLEDHYYKTADRVLAAGFARSPAPAAAEALIVNELIDALYAAVITLHPTYANTAGPRGGIGGSAITSYCAVNDPYTPEQQAVYDNVDRVLRAAMERRAAAGAATELPPETTLGTTPVAWRWQEDYPPPEHWSFADHDPGWSDVEIQPLYAHPAGAGALAERAAGRAEAFALAKDLTMLVWSERFSVRDGDRVAPDSFYAGIAHAHAVIIDGLREASTESTTETVTVNIADLIAVMFACSIGAPTRDPLWEAWDRLCAAAGFTKS